MSPPLGSRTPQVPGPGSYEVRSQMGSSKGYSIGVPRKSRGSTVPGPGTYDHTSPGKNAQTPQWSMAARRNRTPKVEENLGPGPVFSPTVGGGPKFSHGLPR